MHIFKVIYFYKQVKTNKTALHKFVCSRKSLEIHTKVNNEVPITHMTVLSVALSKLPNKHFK